MRELSFSEVEDVNGAAGPLLFAGRTFGMYFGAPSIAIEIGYDYFQRSEMYRNWWNG